MLSEKQNRKNKMTITRQEKLKIVKMLPGIQTRKLPENQAGYLFPPRSAFTSGYIKPKDNDPL
jgi:hypothetical protein